MRRVLNTYGVDECRMLLDNSGINTHSIETFILAHGSLQRGRWFGGVVFRSSGKLHYLAYRPEGNGVDHWEGQHELDFPELPDTLDREPFILNEWLAEVHEGG